MCGCPNISELQILVINSFESVYMVFEGCRIHEFPPDGCPSETVPLFARLRVSNVASHMQNADAHPVLGH
jgi:hypothetical protein